MTRTFTLLFVLSLTAFLLSPTTLNSQRSCSSVDIHEQKMQEDPTYRKHYLDRQEKLSKLANDRANDPSFTLCANPVLVPMAVHYSGVPNNPDLQCLTDLALSQIQILNDDYQGLNADITNWTNGASSNYPGLDYAESCIQFCLATQNHPSGYGLTEGEPAVTINEITGADGDWSGYINIFVRNIGALGFSPLGGNGNGDGVTIDNGAFGAGAGCTGFVPGAPYNLGRTLTHELGHYLNLDHIWGGGCNNDDGIADTPDQASSNGGCPSPTASSCGSIDLHMNYMDYTNDACMYMFSAGQQTVMENYLAANLGNVTNNSSVCVPPTPSISFINTATSLVEGTTSCATDGSQQLTVELAINIAPSATATVILSPGGTATNGVDYTISPNALSFPAGQVNNQMFTVTIMEDGEIENDETINIGYTVIPNGGDAEAGTSNQQYEISILNDDQAPSAGQQSVELFNQDFNNGIAPFTVVDGGDTDDTWILDPTGSTLDGSPQALVNSDAAGSGTEMNEVLLSTPFNGNSVQNLTLDFDQYINVYAGNGDFNETFRVEIYDGQVWQTVFLHLESDGDIGDWNAPDHQTIDLSAHAASNNQIRFTYIAEYDWWWALDNIVVSGLQNIGVQTAENAASGFSERDFGPQSTLYFYDENSGDIMMSLTNNSNFNYGCTSVYVETGSSNAPTAFESNAPESRWITEKTFRVEPENNNANGAYTVSLYYTQAEVTGWIQTSGESESDMVMVKASGTISNANSLEIQPVTQSLFGSNRVYTASYSSGFSGFALGGAPQSLPVEWLGLTATAKESSINLNWSTATESGNKYFEVLRRETEEVEFKSIGQIDGAGNSQLRNDYQFEDLSVLPGVVYFYQIKQVDFDGQSSNSPMVNAQLETDRLQANCYPNPINTVLNVDLYSPASGKYSLMHASGVSIYSGVFAEGTNRLSLNVSKQAGGLYFLVIESGNEQLVERLIIK